jgi:carbamoyltransferase
MRDRLNRIKQRAPYRPFAPAVLAEHVAALFDGPVDAFMNRTAVVRPAARDRLAAVTHVDGTARVQAIAVDHGPFRLVVESFARRTGLPAVLNTSLNLKGRPIVCTAAQALNAFEALELDAIAVGDCLIVRDTVAARRHYTRPQDAGAAR